MLHSGAGSILLIPRMIIMACMVFSVASGPAYGDTTATPSTNELHHSLNLRFSRGIRCADQGAESSFCTLKTELRYRHYLKMPLTPHERFSATPSDIEQSRENLLSIFKLALEEFNLLSGVRIYWDHTEKNIEQWAIKLKLKGEISVSDPHYHNDGPSPNGTQRSNRIVSPESPRPSGLLSLLAPQKIRWNMGMNPDDLTMFGDIHINPYLSISGKLGDESNVGLYFHYAF